MNLFYTIFVYTVWFLSTFFIITFLLHAVKYKKKLFESPKFKDKEILPMVSIIVPAYNEEKTIVDTIKSLKAIDYPKRLLEIIILSDGSKDNTSKIVSKYADGQRIIFIDNKVNKGKAACLNQGIKLAKGDFICCMDADSEVMPDIIIKTLPYFKKEKVGAVTVTVEAIETKTILQKVVDLEFILGLSLFLKVFSFFNCIFVTPGPFSIYRASMLKKIGGFDEKNITEDLEIAYRIHKAGYKIENTMATKVKTHIPNTFKKLHVQRKRWYTGAILTFWQHRDVLRRKDLGVYRYFLPFNYSLIFLGIALFLYSTYLGLSNLIKHLMLYSLTGYNFFEYWTFNFDMLSVSIFSFFGLSAFMLTLAFIIVGMNLTKNSIPKRVVGFFGYLFLFILYQLFWVSSIAAVVLKRKAKWR